MSKGKVLLVDDNDGQREVISELLEKFGYDVVSFDDARQLLEHYRSLIASGDSPTAIVSDNDMPHMTGTELARDVRKLDKSIPFLLLSQLDVKNGITAPLAISFLRKDKLYQPDAAADERNVLGMTIANMIERSEARSTPAHSRYE